MLLSEVVMVIRFSTLALVVAVALAGCTNGSDFAAKMAPASKLGKVKVQIKAGDSLALQQPDAVGSIHTYPLSNGDTIIVPVADGLSAGGSVHVLPGTYAYYNGKPNSGDANRPYMLLNGGSAEYLGPAVAPVLPPQPCNALTMSAKPMAACSVLVMGHIVVVNPADTVRVCIDPSWAHSTSPSTCKLYPNAIVYVLNGGSYQPGIITELLELMFVP